MMAWYVEYDDMIEYDGMMKVGAPPVQECVAVKPRGQTPLWAELTLTFTNGCYVMMMTMMMMMVMMMIMMTVLVMMMMMMIYRGGDDDDHH